GRRRLPPTKIDAASSALYLLCSTKLRILVRALVRIGSGQMTGGDVGKAILRTLSSQLSYLSPLQALPGHGTLAGRPRQMGTLHPASSGDVVWPAAAQTAPTGR